MALAGSWLTVCVCVCVCAYKVCEGVWVYMGV